jgi:hypothetical protein
VRLKKEISLHDWVGRDGVYIQIIIYRKIFYYEVQVVVDRRHRYSSDYFWTLRNACKYFDAKREWLFRVDIQLKDLFK